MELIKKNIHMDRVKCQAFSQLAVEDDINIPDAKADVNTLNFEKGKIQIEEIKVSEKQVVVKGDLVYSILYQSRDDSARMVVLEGKVPFVEKIYMEGVSATDVVKVPSEIEDLTVSMINSRKLNIKALLTLKPYVEELYDEDTTIDLYSNTSLEYCKKKMDIVQIAIQKNDIYRVKEEIELPKSYPNIADILWHDMTVGDIEYRVLDEKIHIQGEINLFVFYEGEGEEHSIRTYEYVIPMSGSIDCHGSNESMIGDFTYEIGKSEIFSKSNFDGEDRVLAVDISIEIGMKLYEDDSVEIISDIYGVDHDVKTKTKETTFQKLLLKNIGKHKIAEKIKIKDAHSEILQLIHSDGSVIIDSQTVKEDSILVQGTLLLQVLYVTKDDEMPYRVTKGSVPISYEIDAYGVKEGDDIKLLPSIEQLQVSMLDSEEMDVKAVVSFKTIIFQKVPQTIITDVEITEVDYQKIKELPGMIVYMVKDGDNLWNIGKKYYVSVDKMKEINNLTSDEIKYGDKLLIVRGN